MGSASDGEGKMGYSEGWTGPAFRWDGLLDEIGVQCRGR